MRDACCLMFVLLCYCASTPRYRCFASRFFLEEEAPHLSRLAVNSSTVGSVPTVGRTVLSIVQRKDSLNSSD
jgi:hypothetical protein